MGCSGSPLQICMGLNSVIALTLHSTLFFSHKKGPVPKRAGPFLRPLTVDS